MRYRKLDADDDYSFGGGLLDFYIDEPAAPGQAAKTRLLLWLGEWFLDLAEGTPYLLGILGKHSKDTADITIQDRVLKTEGITGIEDYESSIDPDTRIISIDFSVNTIFGPTQTQVRNRVNF